MKMENGELAKNDKQNAEVFGEHFNGVYNATRSRHANAAQFIRQREVFAELDHDITWKEFSEGLKN